MKNNHVTSLLFALIVFLSSCAQNKKEILIPDKLQFITGQIENTLAVADDPTQIPRTITEDGKLKTTGTQSWTSGFFAGNLWYLYELTGDVKWKNEAIKWTEALDSIKYLTNHHDVGFMINCSFGNALRLTGNKDYEEVLIQAAKSLSTRYNPNVKCIESWDYRQAWDGKTEWFYPVIIDNMMNLELLFKASQLSGDESFKNIANQHAQTTMKNHYRDDYSSYHVVDYDTLTGDVLDKATCQGFVDESSWARGQAWGFYGFVMCYRFTKDNLYLEFAENIADYLLNHPNLPEDMIPYWDYNVIDDGLTPEWDYNSSQFREIPRDASAAAITCSALFELSTYSEQKGKVYYDAAVHILESLASENYMAISGNNDFFILNHSVGSIPHGVEIDVPLVYADYYFLEVLIRNKQMN